MRKTSRMVQIERISARPIEEILRTEHSKQLTYKQIAEVISSTGVSVSSSQIGYWFKILGLKPRNRRDARLLRERFFRKTLQMFMAEDVGGMPLKDLLEYYYSKLKFSDQEIANFLDVVSAPQVLRWRRKFSIISRDPKEARRLQKRRKIKKKSAFDKTPLMYRLESALGGVEVNQIIPLLFSIGYTYQELTAFLRGFCNELLCENTIYKWMKQWGYEPGKMGLEQKTAKRGQRISLSLQVYRKNPDVANFFSSLMIRYHQKHPEVCRKKSRARIDYLSKNPFAGADFYRKHPEKRLWHSEERKAYYDQHPEMREYLSVLSTQRWQRARSKVFCPLFDEFRDPKDCEIIQQSFAKQCQDKECPVYLKAD